ncbi:ATP-grasp fold amidoligase family protein [Microbacterium sp.]|uniref:ATP-grasp fold amidoligase family protein n=1 Tax=Microbacterium sp. TaxID=51671 RepID=UPI003F95A267
MDVYYVRHNHDAEGDFAKHEEKAPHHVNLVKQLKNFARRAKDWLHRFLRAKLGISADVTRLESRISRLKSGLTQVNGRVDKLKTLTLPEIRTLKQTVGRLQARLNKPSFYDQLRMFTYMLDQEFSLEQKKWFIEKTFMRALKYFPNIDDPKTFNEKTNWYKLYYQDPLITECIDKYKFKDYVRRTVGEQYLVPTLGVWESARDIDFDTLPDKFVIKSNWGSGSRHVQLVRDKSALNIDEMRMRTSSWIQPWENVYYHTFDWGYKDIEPRILAEELIEGKEFEYKFFCFDGEPQFITVARDSAPGVPNTYNNYDMDWNLLPFTRRKKIATYPIPKPAHLDEMIEVCRKLAGPFPHVRVDLLVANGRLIVEELTFYTTSGWSWFSPVEWDRKFGDAFTLPEKRFLD